MNYETIDIISFDATKVLSLIYVKNYLRIDNDCDDEFLTNAITTACNYAEKMIDKIIGVKTLKITFKTEHEITKIDKRPILMSEVLEVNVDNNTIVCDGYRIEHGILILKKPIAGNIEITFKAGLDDNQIPKDIKQAMLYHIAAIYQNKDENFSIPEATKEIYNLYRKIKI